jgi:hypothetical protein
LSIPIKALKRPLNSMIVRGTRINTEHLYQLQQAFEKSPQLRKQMAQPLCVVAMLKKEGTGK